MTADDDLGRALAESLTYVGSQARLPHGLVERLTEGVGARARHRGGVRWAPLAAVAAVLALLALTGIVVLRHDPGPDAVPATTGATSGGRSAASLASARWTTLPDAPIEGRSSAVGVWTGSQMLVWGGETTASPQHPLADGASYDPATRVWRTLPTAPISARSSAASVWTGKVLFVWGGYTSSSGSRGSDGATYDPVTRTWHTLPPAPEPAFQQAIALTVGGAVLLLTTPPGNGAQVVHLQVYRPDSDTWTRLPDHPLPSGHPADYIEAVVAGDRVFVWSLWSRTTPLEANATQTWFGIDAVTYDVRRGRWEPNRLGGSAVRAVTGPIWTGREVLLPASQPFCGACQGPFVSGRTGLRIDPTTGVSSTVPHGPVDDLNPTTIWTGSALLALNTSASEGVTGTAGAIGPGATAAWDPTKDTWTRLPNAPISGGTDGVVVWTGHSLLVWGSFYEGHYPASRTGGVELG